MHLSFNFRLPLKSKGDPNFSWSLCGVRLACLLRLTQLSLYLSSSTSILLYGLYDLILVPSRPTHVQHILANNCWGMLFERPEMARTLVHLKMITSVRRVLSSKVPHGQESTAQLVGGGCTTTIECLGSTIQSVRAYKALFGLISLFLSTQYSS